jgi:hypothetical protein
MGILSIYPEEFKMKKNPEVSREVIQLVNKKIEAGMTSHNEIDKSMISISDMKKIA